MAFTRHDSALPSGKIPTHMAASIPVLAADKPLVPYKFTQTPAKTKASANANPLSITHLSRVLRTGVTTVATPNNPVDT